MKYSTKPLTVERLGRILRAVREYHGYTLRFVAEHIGVTVSRLHHWEKGKVAPSHLHTQALCVVLRLDPSFLYRPTKERPCIDPAYRLTRLDTDLEADTLDIVLRRPVLPDVEQARLAAVYAAAGLNTEAQDRANIALRGR